ncbi:alpha/beta hydrolase family protein [Sulfitobacter pacificus]|uniref:alpha/beta hydrolase family protein n=1 Tax=Sulfitobacter pacificus TaxID=1499314 RepID=UPI00360E76ED
MKNILHIAALTLALTANSVLAQEVRTGLSDLKISDARRDRPLEGFIWYPTKETARLKAHQSNGVWQGIQAIEDAEPLTGKRPFVVLSHGMYGNARNQNWLADALVQHGFVVAAIHHPGTSSWMRDPDQARQMWDRPGDISRVIDHVLTDPTISTHIDPERIYMAGHSLGGMTAVALAGGGLTRPRWMPFVRRGQGKWFVVCWTCGRLQKHQKMQKRCRLICLILGSRGLRCSIWARPRRFQPPA